MSIDAVVQTVIVNEDGSGELRLIDRPARPGQNDGIAGQPVLLFDSAPEEVTALNWLPIWGGSGQIILGERKIADRTGMVKIRFVDRHDFCAAVGLYNARKRRAEGAVADSPAPPSAGQGPVQAGTR